MTTSSDHNSKSAAATRPNGTHWQELTERLPETAAQQLSDWIDAQLAALEKSQERFMTGRSILKSLRR
jgi:hypothetical protein